ncbi:MAG: hypothetical protein NC347_14615 [Clostridium sp.]|nr:hypothetical protein [Clostridium sp.]
MEEKKKEPQKIRPEIRKASNRKILRRQMEMLTEYSFSGMLFDRMPETSQAIASLHKELFKIHCGLVIWIEITFFALMYFFKRFMVKSIKFIK